MKTILEVTVIFASTIIMLGGAWGMRDEDFDPIWRKLIGGTLFIAGVELFHHGLNYINALP